MACRISTPTSTKTYTGTVGSMTVHLAHNGKCDKFLVDTVGTNAATLTTYLAIGALKPDLVISAGTAGGFQAKGADVASIFVSTALQNHDRRIPLPGFSVFGVGREDAHPAEALIKALGAFLCGATLSWQWPPHGGTHGSTSDLPSSGAHTAGAAAILPSLCMWSAGTSITVGGLGVVCFGQYTMHCTAAAV